MVSEPGLKDVYIYTHMVPESRFLDIYICGIERVEELTIHIFII